MNSTALASKFYSMRKFLFIKMQLQEKQPCEFQKNAARMQRPLKASVQMNHVIPDLDLVPAHVAGVLDELESIDLQVLFHLYNQIQARLFRGATPGQLRALAAPFERELEHFRTTGSIADRRTNLGEITVRKATELLRDESLGLTHGDRALIAGFILSETKEAEEFYARTVNDLLAGFGLDRIGNITAALTALESQKLLETVEKSGETPQSQKRHRLTAAGYSKATRLLNLREAA